jgi:uncharacterized membrane protein YqjE
MKFSPYLLYAIVIFGAFFVVTVFNQFALHPQIDVTNTPNSTAVIIGDNVVFAKISLQNVPTVINGITASTSIVIGFIGVVVGILMREIFKDESKTKVFFLLMAFLLAVPLAYLSTVYTFLIMGLVDWAVRWALDGLVLSLFMFVIIMLFAFHRLTSGKEPSLENASSDKTESDKSVSGEKKPKTDSLIAEYEVMNEYVFRRENNTLLANSIMISATLLIVTFAVQNRDKLGMNILLNLPNAGFVPILGAVLILSLYFLWLTSSAIDGICFGRIHQIEDILHIEGTQFVYEKAKTRIWFRARRNFWHPIFLLFIGVYVFTAWWLFRQPLS